MRTTVVIPDEVIVRVRRLAGDVPLSQFVRQSVVDRVARLERERLLGEMEAGYAAEAVEPSLDPAWGAIETEGW